MTDELEKLSTFELEAMLAAYGNQIRKNASSDNQGCGDYEEMHRPDLLDQMGLDIARMQSIVLVLRERLRGC